MPIEVPDDKVSVRRADLVRDVKSLVSYGVGCIMGRYSTFAPGLILADAQQTVDDFRPRSPTLNSCPTRTPSFPYSTASGSVTISWRSSASGSR